MSYFKNPSTLVLLDTKDDSGSMWRAVSLGDDGSLSIRGYDFGPGVRGLLGQDEYEFERNLVPEQVDVLSECLGLATDGNLLATIDDRFSSTHALEAFAKEHGVTGSLWNRIGD